MRQRPDTQVLSSSSQFSSPSLTKKKNTKSILKFTRHQMHNARRDVVPSTYERQKRKPVTKADFFRGNVAAYSGDLSKLYHVGAVTETGRGRSRSDAKAPEPGRRPPIHAEVERHWWGGARGEGALIALIGGGPTFFPFLVVQWDPAIIQMDKKTTKFKTSIWLRNIVLYKTKLFIYDLVYNTL
ncbi:hypothetical protein GWI33_001939 [Rhynchophorus ferrugineus]|uniref:Uncharacterized protein n=1 Tax=Rhynchophorus ferrugineus TaxID=354439 RepID=A0A834MG07_RHYFE|nr:hypothetical protein GWI33_001939 [Rhynchophorus ferrugineus]